MADVVVTELAISVTKMSKDFLLEDGAIGVVGHCSQHLESAVLLLVVGAMQYW